MKLMGVGDEVDGVGLAEEVTFTAAVALFPLLSFLNQNQTHFLFFFLLRSRGAYEED